MLDIDACVLKTDGLLNWDDMHSDSGSSGRDHGGDLLKRKERHALEEHGKLRMSVHQGLVHVGILGRARDKQRDPVISVFLVVCGSGNRAVLGISVAVVILEHSNYGKLINQLIGLLSHVDLLAHLEHCGIGILFSCLHLKKKIKTCFGLILGKLILKDTGKSPVLRVCCLDSLDLSRDSVGDSSDELQKFRIRIFIVHVLGHELCAHLRHISSPSISSPGP